VLVPDWSVEFGREGRTRVDDNTIFKRGKSLIPASRMLIEESRRVSDERREVTDALSEARDCEVDIFVLLWQIIKFGCRRLCAVRQLRAKGCCLVAV
jgi:hypothetical protein